MKFNFLLTLLLIIGTSSLFAQPLNDDCINADRLCIGTVLSGTTANATPDAGTDYIGCPSSATIWYTFTTNSAGNVQIDFTNVTFNPDPTMGQTLQVIIISAGTPCSTPTYVPVSICASAGTDFNLIASAPLLANTTYYIQVNGSNSGAGVSQSAQCTYDISITGTAMDFLFPTASITALVTTICQGDNETVNATISDCSDTSSFDWYYNNALVTSGNDGTFSTADLAGDGYLKLIANCGSTCILSDTTDSIFFNVTLIGADAGPDKYIVAGEQVTLEGSGNGNPIWSPSTSLISETTYTPIATPGSTTTYFLTTTEDNCVSTDSVNVFVGEVIIVYTAFTPNGDDINDKWIITNSGQFPNMEVTVYDRSGQRVFHATGYTTQETWWDGTKNNDGKELPSSTYYYVIDLKDSSAEEQIFKGMVNIIR